ncbi:MAG: tetratricopeptide repeat protein [Spirochaetes bacterium]|nr:tetratricopeptide repeat protein [Spirochaetota bacterium]
MDNNFRKLKNNRTSSHNSILTRIVIALFFLIVSIVVVTMFTINIMQKKQRKVEDQKRLKESYQIHFQQKNYLELISKLDQKLVKEPFEVEYLTYKGYSYLYLAEEEIDYLKRKNYLQQGLINLRKALAIGIPEKNLGNIFFCLGKIYYYLGRPYYNFSILYLNKSLEIGYNRKDLLYILGLVYSHTGQYEEAIKVFNISLTKEQSDLVLLAIGINYLKNNQLTEAIEYLKQAVSISKDEKIIEEAYYNIGLILYKEKKYSDAIGYFNKVIEVNENNANAFFYRGEIYYFTGDKIKARADWRNTHQIDPSHIKARERIY